MQDATWYFLGVWLFMSCILIYVSLIRGLDRDAPFSVWIVHYQYKFNTTANIMLFRTKQEAEIFTGKIALQSINDAPATPVLEFLTVGEYKL